MYVWGCQRAVWVFLSMLFALEWLMWSSISGSRKKQERAGYKLLLRTSWAAESADSENKQHVPLNVNHFQFMLFQSHCSRKSLDPNTEQEYYEGGVKLLFLTDSLQTFTFFRSHDPYSNISTTL